MTLHSEQFVVPGAHDFDRVLGAPNFCASARSTELFKVPGALCAEVPRNLVVGSRKVRPFLFSLFFAPVPHSRLESGHHNFL